MLCLGCVPSFLYLFSILCSLLPGRAHRRLDHSVLGDGGQPAEGLLGQQPHQPVGVHHEILKKVEAVFEIQFNRIYTIVIHSSWLISADEDVKFPLLSYQVESSVNPPCLQPQGLPLTVTPVRVKFWLTMTLSSP